MNFQYNIKVIKNHQLLLNASQAFSIQMSINFNNWNTLHIFDFISIFNEIHFHLVLLPQSAFKMRLFWNGNEIKCAINYFISFLFYKFHFLWMWFIFAPNIFVFWLPIVWSLQRDGLHWCCALFTLHTVINDDYGILMRSNVFRM